MSVETTSGRFFGVYLLCSQSPDRRYNGKCYIGFTVNPNRRINQHNRGKDFGGAKKTSSKGPWKMVMIVHGFPNNISALQFEWAWQQPTLSTRLKSYTELMRKQPKETYFQYNFRVLSRMLLEGPWHRLPLTVRWLETDYKCDFAASLMPPGHMKIVSGAIAIKKCTAKDKDILLTRPLLSRECHLCMLPFESDERSRMGCLNSRCKLTCHLICLANHLLASDIRNRGHYIPITGECPLCETPLLWADLLQRQRQMQGIVDEAGCDNDEEDEPEEEFDYENDDSNNEDDDNSKNSDIYELSE